MPALLAVGAGDVDFLLVSVYPDDIEALFQHVEGVGIQWHQWAHTRRKTP